MEKYIRYINVGFIGAGNMGGALATAVGKVGYRVCLFDKDAEKLAAVSEKLGAKAMKSANDVIFRCTTVFIGVKPNMLEELAKEILLESEIDILVSLKSGDATATAWGCDLTYDYVKINGDYRT